MKPHIRLLPTLTPFPLRTFAAMAALPPAPMPTRAGSFRQHLREPRTNDGMGVLSSSGASWSSKPTLSQITLSHFSSSSSLHIRQRHLTRNLVSLHNAQFSLVAFFWAVTYRRGTGVSTRQFTKDIHTKLLPETEYHTLGNPTPSSYQRSNRQQPPTPRIRVPGLQPSALD